MATFTPVLMTKGSDSVTAVTAEDYYNYLFDGYRPGEVLPEVPRAFKRAYLADVDAAIIEARLGLQPGDSDLSAIAALATTAWGRDLLTLASAAAARTALGLGTAATQASSAFEPAGAVAAAIGATQPLDSDLTAIAALATTPFGRGLLTLADAAAARAALGLGTAATQASSAFEPAGAAAAAQAAAIAASQPLDADLTAIAAQTTTSFGRGFLALADAQAARAVLDVENIPTVAFASTANINLASLPSGAIDGYTPQTGDLFLAKNQTASAENGIYTWTTVGGTASRSPGWTTIRQIAGAQVRVLSGTSSGGNTFTARVKATDVLGTTAYSWGVNYGAGGAVIGPSNGGTGTNSVPTAGQTLVGRSTSVYRAQPFYPVPWTANTAYSNYQPVILPTGGIGYSTTDRTSGATWNATERAAWTFVPGGHIEVASAWTCPTGITLLQELDLTAGGAGGGGGGSASSAITQVGGGGGGAGERTSYSAIAVTPGTTYTGTVGAGGTGGNGGAAGGATGSAGTNGGNTSVTIGSITYLASGGGKGAGSLANSTAQTSGGTYGADWGNGGVSPGSGGYASSGTGGPSTPGPGVVGGAGGSPSSTTNGGLGGSTRLASAPNGTRFSGSNGGSATTAGGDAVAATEPGCGGGGGGGGANGGKGGNGSAGAAGRILWRF